VADSFLNNPPLYNQFFVGPGALAPGTPNNILSQASGANSAFVNGFANAGTFNSISLSNPFFVPPAIFNSTRMMHAPQYQEWNLEVQQGIGQKTSVSINYVGNHQIYGPVRNAGLNAYCNTNPIPLVAPSPSTCASQLGITTPFADLPLAPTDARFGTVTQISSSNVGNYNGVTLSVRRRFSALQIQANYTFSHALDEISNAGILPFNFGTNENTLNPQDPFNLRRYNYGNADYDVRHYGSLSYVWTTPKEKGWLGALSSWTISGTAFWRSGLPITAIDDNGTSTLSSFNLGITAGDPVFANYTGRGPVVCTRAALEPAFGASSPCLFGGTQFTGLDVPGSINNWGQQRRNQVWGPHYFDTDLSVMKNFHIPVSEASTLGIGVQFFNILNHPNFDQPDANVSSSTFGQIINTVSVPTSILGSFLGGDASPRLIQVKGMFTF